MPLRSREACLTLFTFELRRLHSFQASDGAAKAEISSVHSDQRCEETTVCPPTELSWGREETHIKGARSAITHLLSFTIFFQNPAGVGKRKD